MNQSLPIKKKFEFTIPILLIILGLVPVIAGTARLIELSTTSTITAENARFFHSPVPVIIHIVSVTMYSLLGAFQFSKAFRNRNRLWHRSAGKVLVVMGLLASLSGLWMSHFYILPPHDGFALYIIRLVVGAVMTLALVLGYAAIRNKKFDSHEAWMIRAYALGMGAGTQVFTHLPWFILYGQPDVDVRTVLMGAGWVINSIVAEVIIYRRKK